MYNGLALVGDMIRTERERRGMDLADFSSQIGLKNGSLESYERGYSPMAEDTLRKAFTLLGLELTPELQWKFRRSRSFYLKRQRGDGYRMSKTPRKPRGKQQKQVSASLPPRTKKVTSSRLVLARIEQDSSGELSLFSVEATVPEAAERAVRALLGSF